MPETQTPYILVVDDAPFFLHYLSDLLETRGYRTLQANRAELVPGIVASKEVAVVLTDLEMPGVAGDEVLRRVRRLRPESQVIIVSSHRDFDTACALFRDGATEYMTKPVDERKLLGAVEHGLNRYADALDAVGHRESAQRRLSELVLLRETGETACSEANLRRLLEKILDSIIDCLAVEMASIMLLGDDGHLHIRVARGLPDRVMTETRVGPRQGVSGYVLETGEPVLVEDLSTDPRFNTAHSHPRYVNQSLLSVPVRGRDHVLGVLNVNNKKSGDTFRASDQELLLVIANQAALAIENFELVSSLHHKARLLRFFSLDSGAARRNWSDVSLEPILQAVLTERAQDIATQRLELQFDVADDVPLLHADSDKLKLLVQALVDNAIKFHRPAGRIGVALYPSAHNDRPCLIFTIHNDGLSVPREKVQDIFDPFCQLGDLNTEKPAGVGIGLAICQAILRPLQGTIALLGDEGEGTTLAVVIPLRISAGETTHDDI